MGNSQKYSHDGGGQELQVVGVEPEPEDDLAAEEDVFEPDGDLAFDDEL